MEGVEGDWPHIWSHLPSGLCHTAPTTSMFSLGILGRFWGILGLKLGFWCKEYLFSVQMFQFHRCGWSREDLWAHGCFACHLRGGLRKTNQNLGSQTKRDPDRGGWKCGVQGAPWL